jgi:hypothetical protein
MGLSVAAGGRPSAGANRASRLLRRGNAPFVVGAVVLVASVAMAALLFASLFEAELAREAAPRSNARWMVYQAGFEHQRLRAATVEALASPAPGATEAALQAYEIFVSRVILLQEGNAGRLIAAHPEAVADVRAIDRLIGETDEALGRAGDPRAQLELLAHAARAMEPFVLDFMLRGNKAVSAGEVQDAAELDRIGWGLAGLSWP